MNALAMAVATALVLAAAIPPQPSGHPVAPAASALTDTASVPVYPIVDVPPDSSVAFGLQAGSRLYPDWKEDHKVHIGERFPLGDTPSSAEVRRFFPAFLIVDGKRINTSRDLVNPAVQIFVYENGAVTDSTWAFLNFPPHYSARSFFTFQLTSVDGYGGGGS